MKADFLLKGGRVIDPSRNMDCIGDVAIRNNRIVDTETESMEYSHVIDVSGCIVSPGLVDYHTHVFYDGSGEAIRPDFMAAQGTTAAVDAGTAGTANFEAYYRTTVASSIIRLKSYLTVYSGGQIDPKLCEDFNPELFNVDRMIRLVDKYRDNILGLKIRLSHGVVPDDRAMDYLQAVLKLADQINGELGTRLRVCVHTTNSPIPAGTLAECLRPGDIFCHCYQGGINGIVLPDGEIDPGVRKARERGVIFDAANGKGNFGLDAARGALKKEFYPDIISSDLTIDKFNIPPHAKNFPVVLSKYLTLGMDLMSVLRAATSNPAREMGMEGQIGTLRPGACADVVVMKLKNVTVHHRDWIDRELIGHELLVPQMTICAGEIQYCATDFWV